MARSTPVHSGYTIINGSTTGSNGNKCDTWIEYKTTQDTSSNTSSLNAYLYTCANYSNSTSYSSTANYGYIQVDSGTKQYLSISGYDFTDRTPVLFAKIENYTITHNSDGTKTITLAGAWSTSHSTYISGGSVSAAVTLPTIPRASSFSVSSGTKYLGTAMTITVTPASNTFYHKLKYALGSKNSTDSLGTSTSYSLTVPLNATWAEQLPTSTSGTLTLTLYTYSDSGYTTQVGSKSSTLTINVPSSVKPTIGTMTVSEGGSTVPAGWGVLVNGKSKIKVELSSVTAGTGSSISSYAINAAGQSGSTNPYTASGTVTGDSDNDVSVTITATATDARGRTSSQKSVVKTVYAYKPPVITVAKCYRSTSDGTASEDGTYITIKASSACSTCNSKNSITSFQYKYRSTGNWTTGNLTDGTEIHVNAGLSTMTAYEVQIVATDALSTTTTESITIPSKEVLVNVNSSGSGLAVGGFSKQQGTFEVFYPFYVYDETKTYDMLNSLVYKGVLDSTTDIDDMHGAEYTGYYAIRSSLPTNYPNSGWTWCYFIVFSNGEVSQQWIFRPSTGIIARHWAGSTPHWYAWHYLTTTHYVIGDTWSISTSFPLNGFITSSTTGVRLALYLPKNVSQVPVVRVTECSGTLRGISGYLNSQSSNYDFAADTTNYTLVATKVRDNLITLQINKTSAYTNVTNNTPVSFYPNKLTLSFEDTEE